jgi:hypothetical protein
MGYEYWTVLGFLMAHGGFYGGYGDIHGIWMGYFTLIRPVTNTMEISG